MSVDTGIASGSRQILVLTVWDVKMSLWVSVFLGESEINDIDLVSTLPNTHQKVIWLDVAVDKRFSMNVFNAGNQLVREKQHCLQGKFAVAEIEQILQAGSKKIEYHSIVITFGSEPTNEGDTDTTSEGFVDAGFIFELRVLSLDALEFNCDLFAGDDVGA